MSEILIIRHGQDEDNANSILNGRRDMPLTALGRKQAATVAEKLRDNKVTTIYTSPLKRALETAQIISESLGIQNVITHPDLIEREFGVLTGKPVADIPKYATAILETDRVKYFLEADGAEDFPTLLARANRVFGDINIGLDENEVALIVAHGDIGKMIRAVYHGWTWEQGLKTPYLDNTGILELRPIKDVIE